MAAAPLQVGSFSTQSTQSGRRSTSKLMSRCDNNQFKAYMVHRLSGSAAGSVSFSAQAPRRRRHRLARHVRQRLRHGGLRPPSLQPDRHALQHRRRDC